MNTPSRSTEAVKGQDLGPLAWVQGEMRLTYGQAMRALDGYVARAADPAQPAEALSEAVAELGRAKNQLHQATGALEMVGAFIPAFVLRQAEQAVARMASRPALCTAEAVQTLRDSGVAVAEYLENLVQDPGLSPVLLFPAYRAIHQLTGATPPASPADLWHLEGDLHEPEVQMPRRAIAPSNRVRQLLDHAILRVVQGQGVVQSGSDLVKLCLGLAAHNQAFRERTFWKVAAGFFQGVSQGLIRNDVYVKRAATRVLVQYASLIQGEAHVTARWMQDLLFFCSQVGPFDAGQAPVLAAVRQAFGLARHPRVDYDTNVFNAMDTESKQRLQQQLKEIADGWSAIVEGHADQLGATAQQVAAFGQALERHFADVGVAELHATLSDILATLQQQQAQPTPELAMEVATTILYLQAMLADVRIRTTQLPQRMRELTQRLRLAAGQGRSEPLPAWMEELYGRVSDADTIGSVVDELRAHLAEAESHLDQFFRDPASAEPLTVVPGILSKARGVLAVLGLVPATKAIQQSNIDIQQLVEGIDAQDAQALSPGDARFEKIGSNLGALGLQIDMLAYQPALAKELFEFDGNTGRLQPLMGRLKVYEIGGRDIFDQVQESEQPRDVLEIDPDYADGGPPRMDSGPAGAARADRPVQDRAPPEPSSTRAVAAEPTPIDTLPPERQPEAPAPAAAADDAVEDDDELREIFLEEAREVLTQGQAALQALAAAPDAVVHQTTLRRAFHTLKGSSRMVGLETFGEAAWAMEQLLNTSLAEQKPFGETMQALCREALHELGEWVDAIAANQPTDAWQAEPFQQAAKAMRERGERLPLATSTGDAQPAASTEDVATVALDGDVLAPLPSRAAGTADLGEASDAPQLHMASDTVVEAGGRRDDADRDDDELDYRLTQALEALDGLELTDDGAGELPAAQADPNAAVHARRPATEPIDAADATDATDFAGAADLDLLDAIEAFNALDAEVAVDAPDATRTPELDAPRLRDTDVPALSDTLAGALFDTVDWDDPSADSPPTALQGADFAIDAPQAPLPDWRGSAVAKRRDDAASEAHDSERLPFHATRPAAPEDLSLDDLEATESLLDDLDESLSASEEGAERWGIHFKDTEIITPTIVVDDAPAAPEVRIDFSSDASLLADLDALSLAPAVGATAVEIAPAPEAPAANTPAVVAALAQPQSQPKSGGNAETETEFKPESSAAAVDDETDAADAAKSLIELGQDENTHRMLRALQLAQELEDDLADWLKDAMHAPLPAAMVGRAAQLHTTGATLKADGSFTTFLHQLADTVAQLSVQAPSDRAATQQVIADSLQEVQSALDGIVAGTGDGRVVAADVARLSALVPPTLDDAEAPEPPPASDGHAIPAVPAEALAAGDAIDPDLFPIFEEEAVELLPRLVGALRRWSGEPHSFDARSEALRVLHTLKGSSRLAGAKLMGELSHRFESEIEAIDARAESASAIPALLERFDALQAAFEALRRSAQAQSAALPAVATAAAAPFVAPVRGAATVSAPAAPTTGSASVTDAAAFSHLPAPYQPELGPVFKDALPGPTALQLQSSGKRQETVRVRSAHINRLINQAGEIQISRSRAESRLRQLNTALDGMTVDLDRLRQQLRELEVQTETQMQSRLALGKESDSFDPLELDRFTRVQELTRMMAETVNDVATVQRTLQAAMIGTEDDLVAQERKGRELQRDLLHTRMVEFDSIAERLHAVVRQASADTGKQAELVVENGAIEMDRVLLERMMGGFEHILRNCVGHGIETPAQRERKGKARIGRITLTVEHEGNDVAISFKDDGAGLDMEAIRRKGVERGLIGAGQIVSDKDLANLIFMPGFTTASALTGISGRGIGMDVVRVDVAALGGRIETATEKGSGTTFRLVMPLTTAVTQVMLVRAGKLVVGIPANLVDGIERVDQQALSAAYERGKLELNGRRVPFYWAGAMLQHSARSQDAAARGVPVVLVRSAAQVMAVHVDEVLGNQEVVVKNLGPQLSGLPGLAGMSVLASGAVLLVYNFIALASVYGDAAQALQRHEGLADEGAAARLDGRLPGDALAGSDIPLVLVVDDSITVRRVTQRLLKREGYRVALAAHGAQALDVLRDQWPVVVLSDIEMPQMDGFELLKHIRADERLAELPVVMITSRTAQKHRDHAARLGASHYLGKPYSDAELLALVRQYADAAQSQPHAQPQLQD